MKKPTEKELKQLLEKHRKWWLGEDGGERADLRRANLIDANLIGANLRRANLIGANLIDANLIDANLIGANLIGANLRRANLIGANLIDANLRRANLIDANLRRANLIDANLSGANLIDANLIDANLRRANLIDANLSGANLRRANLIDANLIDANLIGANLIDANLRRANLSGAKINYRTTCIHAAPEGQLIGYKSISRGNRKYIVKIQIPTKAKRSCATTRKHRCEYAKVLGIFNTDGSKSDVKELTRVGYGQKTDYIVGQKVVPDSYDEDRWNECSHGIHFFLTFDEAVAW